VANPVSSEDELSTWKQIAAHLGVSVRQAQIWEADGLPIRRMPGKKPQVRAYRTELDAWKLRASRRPPVAETLSAAEFGSEGLPSGESPVSKTIGGDPSSVQPAALGNYGGQPTTHHRAFGHPRSAILWGLICLAVLVGTATAFALLHRDDPVRFTFAGSKLVAWDDRDQQAWVYDFRRSVQVSPPTEVVEPVRIVDLESDGRKQVIASVTFNPEEPGAVQETELYCFTAGGRLRWRYRPEIRVRAPGEEFEGPWHAAALLISPDEKSKHIWLALAHHTSWPSFVVKLDHEGHPAIQFFNVGVIYSLAYFKNATQSYILAGGRNTEYDAGAVAVIGTDQSPAVSPQTPGSLYGCLSCENGSPVRYFVFPRSEVNRALNAGGNSVRRMRVHNRGVQIVTSEVMVPLSKWLSEGFYELSPKFELQSVLMGTGYALTHVEAEREGELAHSMRDCPEHNSAKTVRLWTADLGWQDVLLHWSE